MPQPVLLAVDIERSGDNPTQHATLAIGACVMHEGKTLAKERWNGYTDDVWFEPRCVREFWSQQPHLLTHFKVAGTQQAAQAAMIAAFQAFRARWERTADAMGARLQLVSDNPEFDVFHLNYMITTLTQDAPIPHAAADGRYLRCWNSDSLCRGALAQLDPAFAAEWGVSARLRELLGATGPQATHFPEDDAESHAYDASLALGLVRGAVSFVKVFDSPAG